MGVSCRRLRVAFDATVTEFNDTGSARYVRGLLAQLLDRTDIAVGVVAMGTSWPWTRQLPHRVRVVVHDLFWIPHGVAAAARGLQADLIHGGALMVPRLTAPATSVTVHDDLAWHESRSTGYYNRLRVRRSLRAAADTLNGVLTGTRMAADEIARRMMISPSVVHVTPYGIDHSVFRRPSTTALPPGLQANGIKRPYVVMVAPFDSRKNFEAMSRSLDPVLSAHPSLSIVVTGTGALHPVGDVAIVRTGRISDLELAALYAGAEFLFNASLREGFGLPAIEAMACGCPVIASRGTSLEEICGDAALLVDPTSGPDMTEACSTILDSPRRRHELSMAGLENARNYTWRRTADLTVDAWYEMV